MLNRHFSIRMYIDEYPQTINCQDLLEIADGISELLGVSFERMGYVLLHPDHDCKDMGKTMKHTKKNRIKFSELVIPSTVIGEKYGEEDSPAIYFETSIKNKWHPIYEIRFNYPENDALFLGVSIDIKEKLLQKEFDMKDFQIIQDMILSKGYNICTSFVDYYTGHSREWALAGIKFDGITTLNDWRVIDHATTFYHNWKNKVLDIFYMNSIRKDILTDDLVEKIENIVGHENVMTNTNMFYFKLPYSKSLYALGRYIPLIARHSIKKVLEKESICFKDASIIAYVLKW